MGKKRTINRNRPNRYLSDEDRKNESMEEYYKNQFHWTDEQWNDFYNTMRAELPATFRVTGFRNQSKEVQWLIKNQFLDNLIDGSINNKTDSLAKVLPWYPEEMAWQLNASKVEIRKTPELKRLHKFLVSETDCGFISRQEAVSMIPPLLLDIEPHHKILDLCAAPGSKTAQLVEMLHAGSESVPTGIVVANDIDAKRCYMMVHQLQRLQSPCIVVVRQDASIFPKMQFDNSQLMFDRILADVPCSGDGTLRKNQDLWPRWSPFLGINEHFIQMKILRRSLEMLREGGRMVYSTCSLNPVEDEAVVATVLSQCLGSVRLVDISHRLADFVSSPGLSKWRVMVKDKKWYDSIDEVPQEHQRSIRASLFPPTDIDSLNIGYCRRILPQHQNTGGFFVALLEKVSALPWMKAAHKTKQDDVLTSNLVKQEMKVEPEECQDMDFHQEAELPKKEQEDVLIANPVKSEKKLEPIENCSEEREEQDHILTPMSVKKEIKLEPEECQDMNFHKEAETLITPVSEPPKKEQENYLAANSVKREMKLEEEENHEKCSEEPEQPVAPVPGPPKKKQRVFKEDPFLYIPDDDAIWANLKQYYAIDDSFPFRQLMYRNADGKRRNYYFTNCSVKKLVQANSERGDINFVNLGVKVFGISEDKMFQGYRLLQEGSEIVEPFLGATRKLVLPKRSDLLRLLSFDMPLVTEFSEALQRSFESLSIGPVMFYYEPEVEGCRENQSVVLPKIPLSFAGWRGWSSLRHYVGVHERSHLLRLCGQEPIDVLPAARKENKNGDVGEENLVDSETSAD